MEVETPLKVIRRKVLYRNTWGTSPKVSIPRWWVGDHSWWVGDHTEELILEIYPEKIVVKRKLSSIPPYRRA